MEKTASLSELIFKIHRLTEFCFDQDGLSPPSRYMRCGACFRARRCTAPASNLTTDDSVFFLRIEWTFFLPEVSRWASDSQRWDPSCRAWSRPQRWTRPAACHYESDSRDTLDVDTGSQAEGPDAPAVSVWIRGQRECSDEGSCGCDSVMETTLKKTEFSTQGREHGLVDFEALQPANRIALEFSAELHQISRGESGAPKRKRKICRSLRSLSLKATRGLMS